jgi:hypothetical protein
MDEVDERAAVEAAVMEAIGSARYGVGLSIVLGMCKIDRIILDSANVGEKKPKSVCLQASKRRLRVATGQESTVGQLRA